MSKQGTWISKALLVSAGIALATSLGLYMFFKIHQELEIAPAYAWGMGAAVFVVSAVAMMVYFSMRTER